MPQKTLADFDRAFAEVPYLRLVQEIGLLDGGVDPLGLRQLNLNLMDAALPGINNVTTHIRPYAFMAWAWWKAAQIAEERGETWAEAAELQEMVDRLEVLFVWSHFLAEEGEGVPGRNVIGDKLPRAGSTRTFDFYGAAWDAFRNSRRSSTAIMAPIQYGPSIKALGWLQATSGRTFRPSTEAMAAITAMDRRAAKALAPEMLAPGKASVAAAKATKLHDVWPIDEPSRAEKQAFRHLFYEVGDGAEPGSLERRRRDTLDLVLAILEQAEEGLDVVGLRRAMASARLPDAGDVDFASELVPAQRHWASLQARQLQRMALESLLRWVEIRIDSGRGFPDQLSADADNAARDHEDGADASAVGLYLDQAASRAGEEGWPAAAGVGTTDIFELMNDILQAQYEDGCQRVPGLALRGLAYVHAMTRALRHSGVAGGLLGPLGGQPDRLPLETASNALQAARERSLGSVWAEIVERWVIGQHVRWSVARNGDGTQRLRVALDERGWVRLRKGEPSGPFGPTPDRLATALALAAECDLIGVTYSEDGVLYRRATEL
jgi:hypothetical protein